MINGLLQKHIEVEMDLTAEQEDYLLEYELEIARFKEEEI